MGRPSRTIALMGTLCASVTLVGCAELQNLAAGDTGTAATASDNPAILRVEERDLERPDIYATQARGLWDGRFSLGGRWIAVAENVKAERIRITNLDNGREIEGALFQREADLPGPPIMVSMDAAQALGMQAGNPARLDVVVVRTETVEIPAPPPAPLPEAAEVAEGTAAPATEETAEGGIETTTLETTVLGALDEAAQETAPTASGPAPTRPNIQVASGGNKQGADAVTKRLTEAGLPANTLTDGTEDAPLYRVVAGPFPTQAAFDAALAKLKELGYEDAFPSS